MRHRIADAAAQRLSRLFAPPTVPQTCRGVTHSRCRPATSRSNTVGIEAAAACTVGQMVIVAYRLLRRGRMPSKCQPLRMEFIGCHLAEEITSLTAQSLTRAAAGRALSAATSPSINSSRGRLLGDAERQVQVQAGAEAGEVNSVAVATIQTNLGTL